MADRIVFNYTKMEEAVDAINGLATKYAEIGQTFQTSMDTATASWEGESKDAFMKFVTGPVKKHMETNIPELVKGIATLLKNNATAMGDADAEVAKNMPNSL